MENAKKDKVLIISADNRGENIDGLVSINNNLIKYHFNMNTKGLEIDRKSDFEEKLIRNNLSKIVHMVNDIVNKAILKLNIDALAFININGHDFSISVCDTELSLRQYSDDHSKYVHEEFKDCDSVSQAHEYFNKLLREHNPVKDRSDECLDTAANHRVADDILEER